MMNLKTARANFLQAVRRYVDAAQSGAPACVLEGLRADRVEARDIMIAIRDA